MKVLDPASLARLFDALARRGYTIVQERAQFKGARFFGQQFEEWKGPMPEQARDLVDSWRKMRRASYALRRKLRDDYSDQLAVEAKKIVDDFVDKISQLS